MGPDGPKGEPGDPGEMVRDYYNYLTLFHLITLNHGFLTLKTNKVIYMIYAQHRLSIFYINYFLPHYSNEIVRIPNGYLGNYNMYDQK